MSKIKIRNFGPIKAGFIEDDGWIDLQKVTVFIGNQGSGKSTVAKLISTFTWMEKALVRGDYDIKWFSSKNKLKNQYLPYHRLENYFINEGPLFDKTEIEFVGDVFKMKYKQGELTISEVVKGKYPLPQIMYVPAERNFTAYVKSAKELRLTSDSLKEFVTEFDKAKNELKGPMDLPINDVAVEYNRLNDIVYIKGRDYKIKLTEAASGFQSLVPLYLVSWYLAHSVKKQSETTKEPMSSDELERFKKGVADIWSNESLSDEQRRVAISVLSAKFNKTAFINIVEEPEQNLFPSSQQKMIFSLLDFNNMNKGNKLIITTHSPYLINYLTLAIKAYTLNEKVKNIDLKKQLHEIVPSKSMVNPNEIVIYELDEALGVIKKLQSYDGLPSDENQLNDKLGESNELFAQLLEIQQKL